MLGHSIEEHMLEALELFQYAYHFRDSLFILVLEDDISLDNILTDLKVLQASHISCMVVCTERSGLQQALAVHNDRGHRFTYIDHAQARTTWGKTLGGLRLALENASVPVVAVSDVGHASGFNLPLGKEALKLAHDLQADKVFFLEPFEGLEIDGELQSHMSANDIAECLTTETAFNVPREQLELLYHESKQRGVDTVLLAATAGSLFQEIFTHLGSGTLFTEEYPNTIRRGTVRDVSDIARLLKPHIIEGTVRPISEDEIAAKIESFFVYTVNDALVAAAQLRDFGEAAELAKFCTLPRFQGKGRARELAIRMLDTARLEDKSYVFALSVSPKMWAFFLSLEFTEVARETLPEAWKERYDFDRPSKAFILKLN